MFLDGILTFISPCLLPMLPIYFAYFAGGRNDGGKAAGLTGAIGFVIGFTVVFVLMGALAGAFGGLLAGHGTLLNVLTGGVVVMFGLNYLGVLKIGLLNRTIRSSSGFEVTGFWTALLLGVVFSIGWTPCVSAFVGSALMLASSRASALQGVVMLLCYSAGLGVPFLLSAVLITESKAGFEFIKRNYRIINVASGAFLVLMGVLMMTGLMGRVISLAA